MQNYLDIIKDMNNKKPQNICGCNVGDMINIIKHCNNFFIFVLPNREFLDDVVNQFKNLNKNVVSVKASQSSKLYMDSINSYDHDERIVNFNKIINNKVDGIVCEAQALLDYYTNGQVFKDSVIKLEKNKDYQIESILEKLLINNYERVDKVENCGQYAVRGDILDIFNIGETEFVRLEFFDTQLEKITKIGQTNANLNEIEILPNTCVILDKNMRLECMDYLTHVDMSKSTFEAVANFNEIVEKIKPLLESKVNNDSLQWLLPILKNNNIIDCCPPDCNVFYNDKAEVASQIEKAIEVNNDECEKLHENGLILQQKCNFMQDYGYIFENSTNFTTFVEDKSIALKHLEIPSIENYKNRIDQLVYDVQKYIKDGTRVIISCDNEIDLAFLGEIFVKKLIPYKEINSFSDELQNLNFYKEFFAFGWKDFELNAVILPFGWKKQKTVRKANVFREVPQAGDFVVHNYHGIGKCLGTQKMNVSGFNRDYVVIQYAGFDKLYLPVENLDSITKYQGGESEPKVNKLGGAEFAKAKARVRSQLKDVALDMIKVYAERENAKGRVFETNTFIQNEFANAFAYAETEDQLKAIDDISKDLSSGKIMDRLLCGDVGYGKTEVAFRTAMIAIENGCQVAYFCPTTILSMQIFNSAKARFKDFGVKIEVVNRFVTPLKMKEIKEKLLAGEIDFLIGTKSILNDDLQFKDLGLFILDEEQKMGVQDKEKLKKRQKNVHVLTMTATPIPRTLHMSLVKIRDISTIATPPLMRKSVDTMVTQYNDAIVFNAVQSELARSGQVLVVYNRVDNIAQIAGKIALQFPDAVVRFAHGQMDKRRLENTMIEMFEGKIDVLVATTLIESGIDLPNANTMVVMNADRFGLSQLYQLRGRVGRGNRQASAYFLYDNLKNMTEEGKKRLQAISQFTELGSGFKLAMRDLEIRGAGTVLGERQSGHIEKVGYDMYCKLLGEAIYLLQGKKLADEQGVDIIINVDADIPNSFVKNEETRLKLYDSISKIETWDALKIINAEMQQGFGQVPMRVQNLMKLSLIKNIAQKINIKKIKFINGGCQIYFYESVYKPLIDELQKSEFVIKQGDASIMLENDKINGVEILNNVAKLFSELKFLDE